MSRNAKDTPEPVQMVRELSEASRDAVVPTRDATRDATASAAAASAVKLSEAMR